MASRSAILARRSASAGILICDEVVDLRLAWPQLRSADGQHVRIEWRARLACVDSAADRELLVEQFGDAGDVTVAAVAAHFEEASALALRRAVEAEPVDRLLSGDLDADIGQLVEVDVRRSAFAVGLSVVPPFVLRIDSPSLERDRRIAEVRGRFEALSASAGRPADPLGLLRAAGAADLSWSAATPSLLVVAGKRLARIDPTIPKFDATAGVELPGDLGPLRSVSAAVLDGVAVLLVGARDGLLVIDKESLAPRVAFHHATGGDFGFNSACVLADARMLVATHATAGVVAWRLDAPAAPALVVPADRARSLVKVDDGLVAFAADGRLTTFDGSDTITATPIAATSVFHVVDDHFAAMDDGGDVRLITRDGIRDSVADGEQGIRVHAGSPIVAAAGFDLAGVPRVLVALASGGLRQIDFAGGPPVEVGTSRLAVRSLASRPGFAVAVGIDRTRLYLIDLAKPESIGVEIPMAAILGSRVADARFG